MIEITNIKTGYKTHINVQDFKQILIIANLYNHDTLLKYKSKQLGELLNEHTLDNIKDQDKLITTIEEIKYLIQRRKNIEKIQKGI